MIRERYWDFGPTSAAEKLREVHLIALGRFALLPKMYHPHCLSSTRVRSVLLVQL